MDSVWPRESRVQLKGMAFPVPGMGLLETTIEFFFCSNLSTPFPGRPQPVSNCTQKNHSFDTVDICCQEGYDGGLTQIFTLELYPKDSPESVSRNITLTTPCFSIARFFFVFTVW